MRVIKKIDLLLIILNVILLLSSIFINRSVNAKDINEKGKNCNCDVIIEKYDNFVYLGDSITEWYPYDEMYNEDIPIISSGVAGYETTDILKKMDELVYQYNPTKVFILIGTNDLKYEDDSEKETAKNIIRIIKNIKKNRPKAEIYYQSIYPVNRTIQNHWAEERYNDEIKEVNSIVKDYCKKNNITYIDMYEVLADENGNLKEKYTKDGLHLSTAGYVQVTFKLMSYMR